MQLHEVKELKEAYSADDAQKQIAEGWRLIAVVPTVRPNGQSLPCYVLGKPKKVELPPMNLPGM